MTDVNEIILFVNNIGKFIFKHSVAQNFKFFPGYEFKIQLFPTSRLRIVNEKIEGVKVLQVGWDACV